MIAASQAKRLPADRFTAMVRLDENRGRRPSWPRRPASPSTEVSDIFIYGNHSPTMFADFTHAKISGKPAAEVIGDEAWLRSEFLPTVGKRGAAIIAARGLSSAASAANALVDHVRDLVTPGDGSTRSPSVRRPLRLRRGRLGRRAGEDHGAGRYEVVKGFDKDDFAKSKIAATNEELVGERETVKEMLG